MSTSNFGAPLINARKMLTKAEQAGELGNAGMAVAYAQEAVREAQRFVVELQKLPGGRVVGGPCEARYMIAEGWISCILPAGHDGEHMDASGAWDESSKHYPWEKKP